MGQFDASRILRQTDNRAKIIKVNHQESAVIPMNFFRYIIGAYEGERPAVA
jgi:hypothetical protein